MLIGFVPFVVLEGTWCAVSVRDLVVARRPRPTDADHEERLMTTHHRPPALDRSTLDSLRAPQPEARSMPPAMFIDPDVFRHESSVVFERSWLPIAHVSDLAEPGDYVATTIADEPIAVVRRADGSLGAMANVCQHRNATILDGRGSVRAIQCPYHLWTYRLDGSLAAAPDMPTGTGFDPATVCLPAYAVEEWRGFVFVNLDPNASPLAEILADLDEVVGDWGLEQMTRTHTLSYPSPWNWKISVENALESYHHAGTHRHTLDSTFPGKRSRARDTSTYHWGILDHESVVDGLDGFVVLAVFPTFVIAYNPPSSCVWLEVRPLAFDQSVLDIHILVDPATDPDGSGAEFLAQSMVEINAEDIDVNTRTWRGMHSRAAVAQHASPLEGLCWQFRRWLADHLDVGE
jgi:nitrite reductase/ring-hydroxylating ferredoxin subunit